jgi:hypothetical protein
LLTNNQGKIVFAAILGDMLDVFDFYLIGFVLAFIVGSWHLTYGQSAMILLSSGLGAVPGAWSMMAGLVFLFLGFETKGRSIEEIGDALLQPTAAEARTV